MSGSIVLICFLSLLSLSSNGFFEKPLISQFRIRFSKKMASSQVEIASSAPFGCVLRDHNRRERCSREINARNAFQKNLKHLVCISSSAPDENSQDENFQIHDHHENQEEELSPNSERHGQVLDRWARAREMVTAIDKQSGEQRENSPTQSDASAEIPNLGGVSTLVQRWRDLAEAALNQNANKNNPNWPSSPVSISVNTNYNPENSSFVDAPPSETRESVDERLDFPSVMIEDSFIDWESDRTAPSGPPSEDAGRGEGGAERERVRVADVIRRLTLKAENQIQGSHDSEHQSFGNELLPRLLTLSALDHHQQENRCLSPVINSPCIRGRQAFNDLLMQLERDRLRELDSLVERRAVSRFSHKGRIQAMLRIRFLRREADVGHQEHPCSVPTGVQKRLHREAAIEAQRHSHSRVVGAQQHSCHEELVRDEPHPHCEAAVVEAPQHSHSVEVRPQQQHSCHGGVVRDQENLCHKAGVGAQQHSNLTITTGLQQHSDSAEVGAQQHSSHEAAIGNQRHSYTEAEEVEQNSPVLSDRQDSHSTASKSGQPRKCSTVVLLREKFDVHVEHDAADLKIHHKFVVNNIPDVKISSTSNQSREEPHHQEVNNNTEQQSTFSTEDVNEEASPSSCTTWEGASYEACNLDSQESSDRLTSKNRLEENVNAEEQDANNEEPIATNEDTISDVSHAQGDWEEQEASNQQQMGIYEDWISEVSRTWSEWDEEEANNQQITNQDWISEVSRPRSDWEGLRQARYQEMLDPYVHNEDIRQLLERRGVSTFLSSNLRDKMDQLMISRVERLPHAMENQQEEDNGLHYRLEQLMRSHIQRQTHTINSQQEDEEEEEEQVEEEEESPSGPQYNEVSDYVDQVVSGVRSWSHDTDHEVSCDSDQAVSPSLQQPQSSESSSPESQPCSSFTNRSSVEMELMYDLRGHMEQLHREMSELRKSINSCMNMQTKMQRSIKKEVAAAVNSSVRGVEKKSLIEAPIKRGCCVCLEMQVDALLYRCGHMCTCFKCAHELQWSSSKCPICRAPIVDVVRAYVNDS
ncbi:hypothetical protein ACSBR2_013920 [Camellia fascicularis]